MQLLVCGFAPTSCKSKCDPHADKSGYFEAHLLLAHVMKRAIFRQVSSSFTAVMAIAAACSVWKGYLQKKFDVRESWASIDRLLLSIICVGISLVASDFQVFLCSLRRFVRRPIVSKPSLNRRIRSRFVSRDFLSNWTVLWSLFNVFLNDSPYVMLLIWMF